MTPAEVAAKLRQFNEWRRGDYEPSEQPEPPNPYEVGLSIDAAVEMIDRLEASERARGALRAKVEAMERQEPVAFALYSGWALKATYLKEHEACEQRDRRQLTADLGGSLEAYRVEPLYTLPGAQAQPAPSVPFLTPAARDILGERRRQIEVEGWTPLHDDAHAPGELSSAAMGYAQSAACKLSHEGLALEGLPLFWPWEASWFKPSTARHDLVKAGALILAEIERLDRAAVPEDKP